MKETHACADEKENNKENEKENEKENNKYNKYKVCRYQ